VGILTTMNTKTNKKQPQKLGDFVKPQSLNILRIEDKETALYALRKMVEDYNKMDMVLASMDLTPEQNFRFHQFISNNRARARKIIWIITGSHLKDLDEFKDLFEENKEGE
jgi:predicted GTPase